ncbi:AcrR family transcriptional regulator [Spirochaetia bacterium]|nr:AcrR family transcriptional regulator [Spirochaetia bacterium]
MANEKATETSQAQRIIDAAFKCISSKGYANISLREIADEAGVVLSQLNYYYKNKEGLFTEVIKILGHQYLSEIEDVFRRGKPGKENLSALSEYFKEILKSKPELFILLFDFSSMALWSDATREVLDSFFDDMSNLIEKYILDGASGKSIFKDKPHRAVSRILSGAIFGTSIQVVLSHDKEDFLDSLCDLLPSIYIGDGAIIGLSTQDGAS